MSIHCSLFNRFQQNVMSNVFRSLTCENVIHEFGASSSSSPSRNAVVINPSERLLEQRNRSHVSLDLLLLDNNDDMINDNPSNRRHDDDRYLGAPTGLTGRVVVLMLLITVLSTHYQNTYSNRSPLHSSNTTPDAVRDSTKLGASAIGAVTSVFSPFLPFAGGRNLRREIDGTEGSIGVINLLWNSFCTIVSMSNDYSTKSIIDIRGGGEVSSVHEDSLEAIKARRKEFLSSADTSQTILGATEPFVSVSKIAELTLDDLSEIFKYSLYNNREGFNRESFFKKASTNVVGVSKAMDDAIAKHLGNDFSPSPTSSVVGNTTDSSLSSKGFGDIDVLQFCAAMRIFAEWRVVRQVPDGFRAYAVGMSLGQKDIVQNIAKVEFAYQLYMEEQRFKAKSKGKHVSLVSPTLRDLLQMEVDLDVHQGKLPVVKEKTAGMGLLWVRRQLCYQTEIFANINSGKFPDAITAVTEAYSSVYNDIHGWAVQKIFNYSFKAAPAATEIFRFMNPRKLKVVEEKAKSISVLDEDRTNDDQNVNDTMHSSNNEVPIDEVDVSPFSCDMTTDDVMKEEQKASSKVKESSRNPVLSFGKHIASEWDKLVSNSVREWENVAQHITCEWNKLAFGVMKNFDSKTKKNQGINMLSTKKTKGGRSMTSAEIDLYIDGEMTKLAHLQIGSYLKAVAPLIADLEGLFEEMNMNDPTKV
mmetsp:Transcript_3189/g.4372  ORF Transcript_3189/g.4372 Transcript_3189/m.4372 type:complete len:698 (+) Transcript_3189:717-2810(+)|eukprot:CAMPEP_0116052736 /NCGR_PEP_ID=MMETSP0322-20121206/1744_1 /TAXON_ID=163516 /ORGANISM="Leptocylindrus danicus var. apora, Strain B651" /LENGTH=697 /DNA_ID=CAMNT_0003535715 /DNA_START=290 /DNA_END=2383 /DNA_ORIENTATION=+